jgi:SPP1 family predicted phage head-tail adaptor
MPSPVGQRRERVRIEQSVLVQDGQGGHVQGWALRAVVQAKEESLSSREALMARSLTAVLLTAWTIPYRTDLVITDRLLLGKRELHLTSYQDPENKHAELRLLCSEVQDQPIAPGATIAPSWVQQDFVQ